MRSIRNDKPTGKWRLATFKCGLLGKTVVAVEIEVEWPDGLDDYHGVPEYLGGKGYRLAKPDDLLRMTLDESKRTYY